MSKKSSKKTEYLVMHKNEWEIYLNDPDYGYAYSDAPTLEKAQKMKKKHDVIVKQTREVVDA